MMMDTKGCVAILFAIAVIGALLGFVLWAFRLIPAWGIAAGGIGLAALAMAFVALAAWKGSRP